MLDDRSPEAHSEPSAPAREDTAQTQVPEAKPEAQTTGTEKAPAKESLRGSLRENFKAESSKVKASVAEAAKEPSATRNALKQAMGKAPAQTPAQGQTAAPAAEYEPIAPPADMKADEKAVWSTLPPEAQRYLSRRSVEMRRDYQRQTADLEPRAREVSDVMTVVQPVRDEYAKAGISVPDLVRRSIAWDKAFKADRVGAAREFLEAYGLSHEDLAAAANGQQAAQQTPGYLTREEAEALAEEKVQAAFERSHQESLANESFQAIQSFIKEKPLFKDPGTGQQVEAEMIPYFNAFISQGQPVKTALDNAYNAVTKLHPTFSDLQSKLDAKREAEKSNAEAQKAIAASRSVHGGPASGSPKIKASNLRENLRLRMSGGI